MLCMEIDLLCGLYRASLPDGSAAEWPPHPERIFSALVQAWADGGRDRNEQSALEWLEAQEPPCIEADGSDDVTARDTVTAFVPPNDQHGAWIGRFPERRRQPREFRAIRPAAPMIRLFWPAAPPTDYVAALDRIAHRVVSVGHSASLVRARFVDGLAPDAARLWRPAEHGRTSVRVPHQARLARLIAWHDADQRPGSGVTQRYDPAGVEAERLPVASWFGEANDWFVFEDNDGPFTPDILGFALVASRIRAALMKLGPQPAPWVLSGHSPDGGPTRDMHAAILPLQFVGWPHADGRLLGFAIVLPRALPSEDRHAALRAIAAFARVGEDNPTALVRLTSRRAWQVVRNPAPARTSLQPDRWCGSATIWASTTPVLLDRFPTSGEPAEEAAIVASACRNIGLPEPVEIQIHKHSAVVGAETAYPARGHQSRPDWSFPEGSKFARRPRRHVVLRFQEPVAGPVVLGAGRFFGFGLCLPLGRGKAR